MQTESNLITCAAHTTVEKSMGEIFTFMKAYETAERKVVVPVRAQR